MYSYSRHQRSIGFVFQLHVMKASWSAEDLSCRLNFRMDVTARDRDHQDTGSSAPCGLKRSYHGKPLIMITWHAQVVRLF